MKYVPHHVDFIRGTAANLNPAQIAVEHFVPDEPEIDRCVVRSGMNNDGRTVPAVDESVYFVL